MDSNLSERDGQSADGSFGNDDGSYTLYLTESENITDANFGNFCQPTFSIADIKVAEGDAGYTDIEVVVSQKALSAIPSPYTYWTEDGTAIAASGDYQVSDGTLTFHGPKHAREALGPGNSDQRLYERIGFPYLRRIRRLARPRKCVRRLGNLPLRRNV